MGGIQAFDELPEDTRLNSSPATLFQLFLLYKYKVATMDRRSFGTLGSEGQHFLRISTANSDEELAEAINRIGAASRDADGFQTFLDSGVQLTL